MNSVQDFTGLSISCTAYLVGDGCQRVKLPELEQVHLCLTFLWYGVGKSLVNTSCCQNPQCNHTLIPHFFKTELRQCSGREIIYMRMERPEEPFFNKMEHHCFYYNYTFYHFRQTLYTFSLTHIVELHFP